jgi:hypothetical protein
MVGVTRRAGRQVVVGLLGLAFLVGLCLVALQPSAGGESKPEADQYRELRQGFALFRSRPDALPLEVLQDLQVASKPTDLSLVQRLRVAGGPVWALVSGSSVCLLAVEPSGSIASSCSALRRVINRGTLMTVLGAQPGLGHRRVIGLVPDGASKVLVKTPGSRSANASVNQNAFQVLDRIRQPAEEIVLLP